MQEIKQINGISGAIISKLINDGWAPPVGRRKKVTIRVDGKYFQELAELCSFVQVRASDFLSLMMKHCMSQVIFKPEENQSTLPTNQN